MATLSELLATLAELDSACPSVRSAAGSGGPPRPVPERPVNLEAAVRRRVSGTDHPTAPRAGDHRGRPAARAVAPGLGRLGSGRPRRGSPAGRPENVRSIARRAYEQPRTTRAQGPRSSDITLTGVRHPRHRHPQAHPSRGRPGPARSPARPARDSDHDRRVRRAVRLGQRARHHRHGRDRRHRRVRRGPVPLAACSWPGRGRGRTPRPQAAPQHRQVRPDRR